MPTLDLEGERLILRVQTTHGVEELDMTREGRKVVMILVNEKLSQIEQRLRALPLPEQRISEEVAFVRSLREDPGV